MSDVWLGRVNRWVEKLFNVKGGPTVVDIGHQILPYVSYPTDNDQRYLMGWDLFGAAAAAVASVGNQSGFRIRNPPGSNTVGVLYRLVFNISVSGATTLTISNTITVDLGTPMTGQKLDRRIIRSNSSLFLSNQNSTPTITTGNTIATFSTLVNTNQEVFVDPSWSIPLLPGDSVDLIVPATNVGLGAAFWWMERALESSEST